MKRLMRRKAAGFLLAAILVFAAINVFCAKPVYAASGTVYTCTVNRLYQHPVTGVIEDSGGEESYSIGQGMVEGCVYPTGILEVTDDGNYYLTIRMSLMDYTYNHTFWVQTWGADGWSTPAAGITGNGTDSNGTTADICIQVPSEKCVVRGAMYVEPMGRDVYWYMYPSDFSEGNSTDMNATMVTSSSGDNQQQEGGNNQQTSQTEGNTQSESGGSAQTQPDANLSSGSSLTAGNQSLQSGSSSSSGSDSVKPSALQSTMNGTSSDSDESSADQEGDSGTSNTLEGLEGSISAPDSEGASTDAESVTSKAQGLSLSTAGSVSDEAAAEDAGGTGTNAGGTRSAGSAILVNTLSAVIPGAILIGMTAVIVYFFRKNWRRWGGVPDDDED